MTDYPKQGTPISSNDHPDIKDDPDNEKPDSEGYEITQPKMSDRPGANNMISNMASRSALGMAQRARNNQ